VANYRVDLANLDNVIKRTIEAINNSKTELYEIAEGARNECRRLEEELGHIKKLISETMESVELLEEKLKESKKHLMLVSKYYDKYSEEEIKSSYESADGLRVELAIKREQERYCIKSRNEIEFRLKGSYRAVEKADNLISQLGVSLGYLTGDLKDVSIKLEDMQQRQLLGMRIIKAQEEERKRIAREIHDGPAQSMSNVVLKAEICERLVDSDPEKVKDELKLLKAVVRYTLQDVRKIIYNLRPMSLDDLGLIPTLQRYIASFREEYQTQVIFKTRGDCNQLKPVVALTVFRLVQEAVNNINKHANAQKVLINLELLDNVLKLHIADDGIGFDINTLKENSENINGGFGLISMKERVELLNGEFQIDSAVSKGTRLYITVPLVSEEGV
jgi:two-component system sensor histidine kinase DegS